MLTAALLGPLAAAPPAFAADATETARAHFSEGVRRYDARDYAGALDAFRAAYAAKPSPGIKRNIALCLKALGRDAEAIDALDEMLAEGGDALTSDVRDGARAAIAEMSARVATVRVRVIVPSVTPAEHLAVLVDDAPVAPASLVRPLRLAPGEHVLRARADGYRQAEQHVRLSAGEADVPVVLELVAEHGATSGRAIIRTNVAAASIAIDGTAVGKGSWTGDLPAGVHRVEARARGYPAQFADLEIGGNDVRELAIDMTSAPPAYAAPARPPAASRAWYAIGGLGVFGQELRYSDALGNHERNEANGGSLVVHFGRTIASTSAPTIALGVAGELASFQLPAYDTEAFAGQRGQGSAFAWSLAPELRVLSRGKVRVVGGVALGIAGLIVRAQVPTDAMGTRSTVSGAGVSGVGLVEGGMQFDVGRVLLEGTLFADVRGVGAPRDPAGQRFFADSPAARAGVRLMIGWAF